MESNVVKKPKGRKRKRDSPPPVIEIPPLIGHKQYSVREYFLGLSKNSPYKNQKDEEVFTPAPFPSYESRARSYLASCEALRDLKKCRAEALAACQKKLFGGPEGETNLEAASDVKEEEVLKGILYNIIIIIIIR